MYTFEKNIFMYIYLYLYITYIIQSWPKISAPLQLCQKMQPFSQKIVAVTNVLVLTFIIIFVALEQYKKTEEKSNLIQFHTEPQKMHWTKLLATLT